MDKANTKFLVISVLGPDQPNALNELIKLIASCGCNIMDSRVRVLGMELTATLLLSGNWNEIAKLEALLPAIISKLELTIQMRRTGIKTFAEKLLPYNVHISTLDSPGIIYKITQFFTTERIAVNELYADAYLAPYTNAPMVTITMSVSIPAKMLIADLREQFMLFCDDHNLDVVMEPQK